MAIVADEKSTVLVVDWNSPPHPLNMSAAAETRAVLRQLLRATRVAFRGDHEMLTAAHTQIFSTIRSNINTPPESVPPLIEDMRTATDFLLSNVIQAPLNEEGRYQVKPQLDRKKS